MKGEVLRLKESKPTRDQWVRRDKEESVKPQKYGE